MTEQSKNHQDMRNRFRSAQHRASYVGLDGFTHRRARPTVSVVLDRQVSTDTSVKPPILSDVTPPQTPEPAPAPVVVPVDEMPAPPVVPVIAPQPFATPAEPKQQPSAVLKRQQFTAPQALFFEDNAIDNGTKPKFARLRAASVTIAILLLLVGLGAGFRTILTSSSSTAQIAAVSDQADSGATADSIGNGLSTPSTTRPSDASISQYVVAADMPKYIKIDRFGTVARVSQVGVRTDGSLATPSNVYDAAWYTGSAKPGQPGAALINGYVSSQTTPGVFHDIQNLSPNDTIEVARGDDTVVQYRVVAVRAYDAQRVDMEAAITPVTAGKPGLNLITCAEPIKPGSHKYNQRYIVFTEQL